MNIIKMHFPSRNSVFDIIVLAITFEKVLINKVFILFYGFFLLDIWLMILKIFHLTCCMFDVMTANSLP